VILYLIDENVFREMRPGGDKRVRAWLQTVDDNQLRISAITFFEKRRGWERNRRRLMKEGRDCSEADAALAAIAEFETAYAEREIPIDTKVGAEWARLLGAKDKNQVDMALAATARVHDLVLVTRNVKDFQGRGIRVLNPFDKAPMIRRI
jgi:predicted nucleic acid-binding protein